MNERKEIPPVEVSLKYMAWNIKEISENIKKLTNAMDQYLTFFHENMSCGKVEKPKIDQQQLPF